jgi:hypothetical protein
MVIALMLAGAAAVRAQPAPQTPHSAEHHEYVIENFRTDLYFPVGDARFEAQFIPRVSLVPIPSLWGHPTGAGGIGLTARLPVHFPVFTGFDRLECGDDHVGMLLNLRPSCC